MDTMRMTTKELMYCSPLSEKLEKAVLRHFRHFDTAEKSVLLTLASLTRDTDGIADLTDPKEFHESMHLAALPPRAVESALRSLQGRGYIRWAGDLYTVLHGIDPEDASRVVLEPKTIEPYS
jgi:hypothetical protein